MFAIEGSLLLRSRNSYYCKGDFTYMQLGEAKSYDSGAISHGSGIRQGRSSVKFRLQGFWLESSGNLCMVGSGYTYSKQGKLLHLEAVLKLVKLKNLCSITTLVSGSFESFSSTNDLNYFEPISILVLPRMSYEYTLASKEFSDEFSGGSDAVNSLPLTLLPRSSFCSVVSRAVNEFNLKYTKNCSSEIYAILLVQLRLDIYLMLLP